jgi:hypothetical protein
MRNYKGLQFSEGLSMPLTEFKKSFKGVYLFRDLKGAEQDKELEAAYLIATNGNIKKSVAKRKKSESDSTGESTV